MTGGGRIRQAHRWLAAAFTVAVVLNFAAMGRGEVALWIGRLSLAEQGAYPDDSPILPERRLPDRFRGKAGAEPACGPVGTHCAFEKRVPDDSVGGWEGAGERRHPRGGSHRRINRDDMFCPNPVIPRAAENV